MCKQQVQLAALPTVPNLGLCRILCGQHLVAGGLQDLLGDFSHEFLVFDKENGLAAG
jgi:hypothetical protein